MSSAPEGPFLYDDDPEPLHTGTPRNANRLLLLVMLGTVLVGVAMVLLLPVVRGTPEEQSSAAVNAFYAALADGDIDSAGQLLCEAELERLVGTDPRDEYARGSNPQVTANERGEVDGDRVQHVSVRWDGGATATVTVVNEDGPHVCGID